MTPHPTLCEARPALARGLALLLLAWGGVAAPRAVPAPAPTPAPTDGGPRPIPPEDGRDEDDAPRTWKEERVRLRSSDKWVRKSAVEALARFDTQEAWELVLGALADEEGEVADTAQFLLAELTDERVARRLLGADGLRSRDPWVERRAAEVLGRWSIDLEPEEWKLALRADEPEARRMAAWSVERRAAAGRIADVDRPALAAELERLLRSAGGRRTRTPELCSRALLALVELDPERAAEPVEEALHHASATVRVAAAAALVRTHAPDAALERLRPLAEDEDVAVRTQLADSLAWLGTRASVRELVERLAAEPEGRLRDRIVAHLQALSGRKHRHDPRPWRDWANGLAADWVPPLRDRVPAPGAEAGGGRYVTFAGLPLSSRRLVFLIDLSGSIWQEREGGRTRKQAVDEELARALRSLPEGTRFNLIPFTAEPHPWREGLVEATRARVEEAIRWFERRRDDGQGNFWDAALLALADPEVDTLVVLTDGAPTGGRRFHLELITSHFLELNETRKAVLDSILVGSTRNLERQWAALSRATGGASVAVELD